MLGEQGLIGQTLADRLGHSKVDDLGNGLSVFHRHQYVRGFDVPVNNPFLVGVLDGTPS